MPKMLCTCDNVIFLHEIPCPHEWRLISDVEYGRLWEEHATHEQIADATTLAVKCDECGRLFIYWDGFDKQPTEYVPAE